MKQSDLELALRSEEAWRRLVEKRSRQLRQFLQWAVACEAGGHATSLRLEHREDIARCRAILHLFFEPWWGVVMYSCFDSIIGTQVVAASFSKPIGPAQADKMLASLPFPPRSVQHHRTQSTLKGAKLSLLAACQKAQAIREILLDRDAAFEDRFERLVALDISWWGRTTCFDVLLRAGALGLDGQGYRPNTAHLLGSSGPSAGFSHLWGVEVAKSNADVCERILKHWCDRWNSTANIVGVKWTGRPYDSGDFENALCIFQEATKKTKRPDPASFNDNKQGISSAFERDPGARLAQVSFAQAKSQSPRSPASTPALISGGHLRRGLRVVSKTKLMQVLRGWFTESRAPTVGDVRPYRGRAWLHIDVNGHEIALNADTKRSAIEIVLRDSRSDPERGWRVVANSRGRFNKVLPNPSGDPLPGWYAYLTRPLPEEGVI